MYLPYSMVRKASMETQEDFILNLASFIVPGLYELFRLVLAALIFIFGETEKASLSESGGYNLYINRKWVHLGQICEHRIRKKKGNAPGNSMKTCKISKLLNNLITWSVIMSFDKWHLVRRMNYFKS